MKTSSGAFGAESATTYPGTETCCTAPESAICDQMAADQTKSTAEVIGEKADHAVEAVGVGMETVGRNIREHTPHIAGIGAAGAAIGEKIEAGGHYLEDH